MLSNNTPKPDVNISRATVGEGRPGVRVRAPGKARVYCPIRLVQTHHSLLGALVSVGLEHDEALALIEDAKVKQCRYIFANPGNGDCFVVVSDSGGVVQIWQAMTDDAKPGRGEAEAFIMAQRDKHNDASKLAVFPLYANASSQATMLSVGAI